MAPPTAFVTSATGTQGSAVARHLRSLGWSVHATSRNPSSADAQALTAIGVRVTPGSWDDEPVLESSIAGCQFLFLNLFPDLNDASRELTQAKTILRIAKATTTIQHVVYSGAFHVTALLPDYPSNHWSTPLHQSKQTIPSIIQSSGFQYWTHLQPGYFMANLLDPKVHFHFKSASETGIFAAGYLPSTLLPLIDHEDIASFVVSAFQNPEKFHGKNITFAGQLLPFEKTIELLGKAASRNLRVEYLSDAEIAQAALSGENFMPEIQKFTRRMAELVDVEESKAWGVQLGTFQAFLDREADAVKATFANVPVGA
ncbi:hypothetical protein B0H63DRAFT_474671 [Podospora didyma]|uniref:NmrA-like domain-containing protein n=1 Tax=Podospora didyma TaxID=330526 RepID=A0AAE0NGE5_9PEZI|nr:hypothetical protein B0H63DRAFT_474671 [Podospora didyma]